MNGRGASGYNATRCTAVCIILSFIILVYPLGFLCYIVCFLHDHCLGIRFRNNYNR